MSVQDEIKQCEKDIAALQENLKKLKESQTVPARKIKYCKDSKEEFLVLSTKNLLETLQRRFADGNKRDYVVMSFENGKWTAWSDMFLEDTDLNKVCYSVERVH